MICCGTLDLQLLSYLSARCWACCSSCCPSNPRGHGRALLPKQSRSEIPEGPLIVIRKVFGRGLAPSQATASRPSTPVDEHSACESLCEGFLFSSHTYPNTTNVTQLNHLILCQQLFHICSPLITLQSDSSVASLYIIIRY